MYDELPQDHQDLSTRWTDDIVDKQTLLYRSVPIIWWYEQAELAEPQI